MSHDKGPDDDSFDHYDFDGYAVQMPRVQAPANPIMTPAQALHEAVWDAFGKSCSNPTCDYGTGHRDCRVNDVIRLVLEAVLRIQTPAAVPVIDGCASLRLEDCVKVRFIRALMPEEKT